MIGNKYWDILSNLETIQKYKFLTVYKCLWPILLIYTFLCVCASFLRPKAGPVQPEETVVARQRLSRHVAAVTNTHARTENC
jgi:hypothetical protein